MPKTRRTTSYTVVVLLSCAAAALAVGSGFTFQGQLQQSGAPQNGTCDFQFSLFDAASSGTKLGATQTVSAVALQDGLFTALLNSSGEFGATAFDGADRWLEMTVRCPAGSGSFSAPFTPRQLLSATPYALYASTAADVSCSGCLSGAKLGNDSVNSSKIVDGSIATGDLADGAVNGNKITDGTITASDLANAAVAPSKIAPGTNAQVLTTVGSTVAWQLPSATGSAWALNGNAGTSSSTNFIGTTDSQALEVRVNNSRILRLEPAGSTQLSPNIIGGDFRNYIATGVIGATVAGGGRIFGPLNNQNRVLDSFGTVSGGEANKAGNGEGVSGDGDFNNAAYATVSGGINNQASAANATVGGGTGNSATASDSTIGGGINNLASGAEATVGGGSDNMATQGFATVAGGNNNSAPAMFASVGGGNSNTASADSAAVGGGVANNASGTAATVGGGSVNSAAGDNAAVSGGESNNADADWAVVGGGLFNKALARWAVIGGGGSENPAVEAHGNIANDEFATIAGGSNNQAGVADANSTNQTHAAIGGGAGNRALAALATIGGGGGTSASTGNAVYDTGGTIGGGSRNSAGRDDGSATTEAMQMYATVGGGGGNRAIGRYATVGGGGGEFQADGNTAADAYCSVGGGEANQAGLEDASQLSQQWATVCGGFTNRAFASGATIAGGTNNLANGSNAFIGGGSSNNATGSYSMVVGGLSNTASGSTAFAAGRRAMASNDGCFVWGDATDADISCSSANRFVARASGGVQFYSNAAATMGVQLAAGGGSWAAISDRNVKDNIVPVSGRDVLAKLASTPIHTWNYRTQDASIRHIGPMAQDFHAAFNVGEDARLINNVDADGVALAAIQGLRELLLEKDAQLAALEARVRALEASPTAAPKRRGHSRSH